MIDEQGRTSHALILPALRSSDARHRGRRFSAGAGTLPSTSRRNSSPNPLSRTSSATLTTFNQTHSTRVPFTIGWVTSASSPNIKKNTMVTTCPTPATTSLLHRFTAQIRTRSRPHLGFIPACSPSRLLLRLTHLNQLEASHAVSPSAQPRRLRRLNLPTLHRHHRNLYPRS
jgi:hypothetical protein